MVVGATAATTVDEHDTNASEDDADAPDEEPDDEQDETAEDGEADEADDEQQPAHVTFEDQESDDEAVVVDGISMVDGGFVTIHDSNLLAGDALGSVVGVSAFLEEGTHEDVEITLDEPLEEDETLIAMPHRDTNDDQEYDFVETESEEDVPYLTADDEPVTDEAVVTLEEAPEEDSDNESAAEELDEDSAEEEPEEPVEDEPIDDEPVGEETEAVDKDAITIVIERATVFVAPSDDEMNGEIADDLEENGTEDDAETALGFAGAV